MLLFDRGCARLGQDKWLDGALVSADFDDLHFDSDLVEQILEEHHPSAEAMDVDAGKRVYIKAVGS